MNIFKIYKKETFWFVACLLLLIPAFLPELGSVQFIEDEAIRSLVSLEMKLSGNYITSTIGGELYLKKPPLYNWIIAASFTMFGSASEFAARFPTVVFLLLFALTVFLYLRKYFSWQMAGLVALSLVTSGRILIYESQKGLIDILFSWIVFTLFMVIYENLKTEKYWKLFILSYLLGFLAYMLKGLPALVFLGTTLLATFIYFKQWKKLFSMPHFTAILMFALLFAGFYIMYFQINNIPISKVYSTLIGESTRRTFIKFGFWDTLQHLFIFPFEVFFHFLPYTLFVVFLVSKDVRGKVVSFPILKYFILVLTTNIIVYWTSPEVFARYLLMFIPLIYAILICGYVNASGTLMRKVVEWVMFVLVSLTLLAIAVLPWIVTVPSVQYYFLKWFLVTFLLSAAVYVYFTQKEIRLVVFVFSLLVIRMGFNWFVIPSRAAEARNNEIEVFSEKIAELTYNKPMATYWPSNIEPDVYFGKRITNYIAMFYITRQRQQILRAVSEMKPGNYYLARKEHLSNVDFISVYDFKYEGAIFCLIVKK